MDSRTTATLSQALQALEQQRLSLEEQLARVRTAIEAINPLVTAAVDDLFDAADDDETDVDPDAEDGDDDSDTLFGSPRARSNVARVPAVETSGFRSSIIAEMTQSVVDALRRAKRPMAVSELLDTLRTDRVKITEPRQLTDMLYRKSKKNGPFRRVANGLYILAEQENPLQLETP